MRAIKFCVYKEAPYYVAQCLNVEVSSFGDAGESFAYSIFVSPNGRHRAINNFNHVLGSDNSLYLWDSSSNAYRKVETSYALPTGASLLDLAPSMNDDGLLAGRVAYPGGVTLPTLFIPAAIGVDADRDGIVALSSKSDETSKEKPFRFWINDDIDRGHTVDGSDWEEDDIGGNEAASLEADWKANVIPSKRDLEDFFRLQLYTQGLNEAFKNGDLYMGLKWADVTGTPAVKLYMHMEVDGGLKYLTDEGAAHQQITTGTVIADERETATQPASMTRTVIEGADVFVLPKSLFAVSPNTAPEMHLIAEGCKTGKGQLKIVILKKEGGRFTEIGGGPSLWLELNPVKELYEHWSVGRDANGGAPAGLFQLGTFSAPTTEDGKYILYVHGWNMEGWEKERFSETAYKRLYWQGYKGRFGLFSWPTTHGFLSHFDAVRDSTNYDRGEWTAWRSAAGLKTHLEALNRRYPGQVYMLAHSMGNVVAGEALQLAALAGTGAIVNTYVASQAALPAHCYDGSRTDLDLDPFFTAMTKIGRTFDGSTFPQTANVYRGWLATNGNAAANRINFYNENDYALWHDVWELDQFFKPDLPDAPHQPYEYRFFGNPEGNDFSGFAKVDGVTTPLVGDRFNVRDRYEIMAFASESRTRAVGASPNALGMRSAVNLQDIWPADTGIRLHGGIPFSAHKWHSAQFRSTNMRQKGYWQLLLGRDGFRISIP
ncbi:alpha/beta hydrolase [Nibricoccus sp. IMCC34717]|uniref:alpha/beta hydrolase n=1 Tax=Nibricoccus sp. IMCC34717 TaxID=3034021 RepID=UPI00384C8376